MAVVTKLDIYQLAVRHLADARLALISDDVETRYALDDAWDRAVLFVLGQAPWRFAMKTAGLATNGQTTPGYTIGYGYPADWLRTHAIFITTGSGSEHPIDLREQGLSVFTNSTAPPTIRYISNTFADPALASNPWPEPFGQVVGAYLAFLVAERVTGERSAPGRMSQLFSSLLPEAAAIHAVAEDPWLEAQRDGTFLRVAREMIDHGFWSFAMKVVLMTTVGASVALPADWARTRKLFVLTADSRPRPLVISEQGGLWITTAPTFYAQYTSITLAIDSTKWPAHYKRAVLREIHFDRSTRKDVSQPGYAQVPPEQAAAGAASKDALAESRDSESDLRPDEWLKHQLSGTLVPAMDAVVVRGNWRFAMKTVQIDSSMQVAGPPEVGFPYAFDLPSDWLNTQALYLSLEGTECPFDIRESAGLWSTAAPLFTARYLTTAALDTKLWPEPLTAAVLAYLDWQDEPEPGGKAEPPAEGQQDLAFYEKALADAIRADGMPDSPWLRFQLDGTAISTARMLLEKARWRFAVQTKTLIASSDPTAVSDGTPSPGYIYRFNKPNDWMRTLRVYQSLSDGAWADWNDLDYRDELDGISANYSPVVVRYVSRLGLDSTRWSFNFRDAVLAFLEYTEARANPKLAAVAARKLEFFKLQIKEAEIVDDESDVPRVINVGRFVTARYGRGNFSRKNAWPPPF